MLDWSDDDEASPSAVFLQSVLLHILQLQRRIGPSSPDTHILLAAPPHPTSHTPHEEVGGTELADWMHRLGKLRGLHVELSRNIVGRPPSRPADVIVRLSLTSLMPPISEDPFMLLAYGLLLPGGTVISRGGPAPGWSERWWPSLVPSGDRGGALWGARRAGVGVNSRGAPYWREGSGNEEELRLLDSVTVSLSGGERSGGTLSEGAHGRAVAALRDRGLVIIGGLLGGAAVAAVGEAAQQDLALCVGRLRSLGMDIEGGGGWIDNFNELSMREARRCDMRGTPRITEVAETTEGMRGHASVLRLLGEVMRPAGEHDTGDWGRWNFGGSGPYSNPPALTVGRVGAVLSLPGAADQTLHADTPHLFTHLHLPPHYVNQFWPALTYDDVDDDDVALAGQTAFVLDSHELRTSSVMLNGADGERELASRLVRPHLRAGDCLLFDCRLLHFGLANASTRTVRPVMYVNYHHHWFSDLKNFTKEKLL